MLIKIPWDRANHKIKLSLRLLDPDGHPIALPGIDGNPTQIGHEGEIEVGRPASYRIGQHARCRACDLCSFDAAGAWAIRVAT